MTKKLISVCTLAAAVVLALSAAAGVNDPAISSNLPLPFPEGGQNEPALALDRGALGGLSGSALKPGPLLVAGGNDYRDQRVCTTSCSFTDGVGISGVYYQDNSSSDWMTASYPGYVGSSTTGRIGTLPNFSTALWSGGDPTLAAGPRPRGVPPGFSWSNGTRFYYATLAASANSTQNPVITVSYSDPDQPSSAAMPRWSKPRVVSLKTPSADKPAIWADDAAEGTQGQPNVNFGRVYVCWTSFKSESAADTSHGGQIMLTRSSDGGRTWKLPEPLSANGAQAQGCEIRTDSNGSVYVVWEEFAGPVTATSGTECQTLFKSKIVMARPTDNTPVARGRRDIVAVQEAGRYDKSQKRCTVDGNGGTRANSFPDFDIANGAPAKGVLPNEIALAVSEGATGQVLIRISHDLGSSWSSPVIASRTTDKNAAFPAVALSPDGAHIYVVYNAFLADWQSTTTLSRPMQAVLRVAPTATLQGWGTVLGTTGDARASGGLEGGDETSQPVAAEFLGDKNAIVATNRQAWAAWTDVSAAADCNGVDNYRQSVIDQKITPGPKLKNLNVLKDCLTQKVAHAAPQRFGNTTLCGASVTAGFTDTTKVTDCKTDRHP